MNDTYQPDPTQPAFCQICGRAVASENDRLQGKAFPCGLCNEIKLATPASTGYVYPGPEAVPGAAPGGIPPGGIPPYATAPPNRPDVPNPGLAALLGLIPGVGAMYNGQYAKGIVHLIVFAVLSSLVDTNGIFLLFVFGWVAYQSIEAHHTARARRDGTPLPNPFGLNDVAEKFGFGKSWPSYTAPNPNQAVPTPEPVTPYTPPPPGAPYQSAPPTSNWGAPFESYRYNTPPAAPFNQQPPPVYPPYTPVPPFAGETYVPFDPNDPNAVPPYAPQRSRFPAGAIWLIALGTLFLLNTSGIFRGLNFRLFLPLFFVGLGVYIFVSKMTSSGRGLADDGSHEYRIRAFRAARGSVWLILTGVIFFLADFDILSWGRSWPLFLILAGVMTVAERAVYRSSAPPAYGYPPQAPPPYGPPPPTSPGTAIVPADATPTVNSQEGR